MTKNKFVIHFAKRNIQANKKSSAVIILTLSLVLTVLILLSSLAFVLKSVFTIDAKNNYQNVDVVVSYDEYSLSRLVNKRYVEEDYANDLNYVLSFFNADVMTKYEGNLFYSSMFSALPNEFEILTDNQINISGTQAVITKSFAKAKNLKVGDSITVYILSNEIDYTVADIINDTGVFSGNSFFIDKSFLFDKLYGLDYLNNLGNKLYIDLNKNIDKYDFIQALESDPNYSSYHIFPAVDEHYISEHANESASLYTGLGLVIVIAIFLVVASLFPLMTRDIKKELGVVKTLGGDKRFIWKVYLLQWLYLILIAFGVALVVSFLIINIATYIYGVKGIVLYSPLSLIISLSTLVLFIYVGALISYKKLTDMTIVEQSADKRYEVVKINYVLMIFSLLLFLVIILFNPFSLAVNSTLIVLSSIYLSISLLSVLIKLVTYLIGKSKRKNSFYKLFQNKYLNDNKHIHQSVKVLLISLIVIVLVFSVRTFLNQEVDKFGNEMKFDLALVNINDYADSLTNEVKSDSDVETAAPAVFYQNIMVNFNDKESELVKFFISMDYNQLNTYFDFHPDNIEQKYIDGNMPYVILPMNFEKVYGLKIGDVINLDLNYKTESVNVVIGGFFATNFDNFVYSNIFEKTANPSSIKINTIFINSDNSERLFQTLIQKYSLNMYYVFNANSYFQTFIIQIYKISDYFMILSAFMIGCFLIVVFNNTMLLFYDLKSDLAKIKVLGVDNSQFIFNILVEYLVVSVIILAVGIFEIRILSEYLRNVILLLHFYKNVQATFADQVYGFALTFIMLILSYIYYFRKISKIKIIEEMRFY